MMKVSTRLSSCLRRSRDVLFNLHLRANAFRRAFISGGGSEIGWPGIANGVMMEITPNSKKGIARFAGSKYPHQPKREAGLNGRNSREEHMPSSRAPRGVFLCICAAALMFFAAPAVW